MTDTTERPPDRAGAPDDARGDGTRASVTAGQLRRRRDAAGRHPPLGDGRRDPLDALAGLPVRRACRCLGAEFTAEGVRPCCQGAA